MNKEQLKKGDIIECCGITAYVVDPDFNDNYVKVNLGNTCRAKVLINKDWLSIWNFVSPIKDNRIVSNETFAIRFKNFISDVNVNDACSFEEKEYLLNVANQLLKYQIETATNESEINYLKNLNLL
jgi:hypothetical protein